MVDRISNGLGKRGPLRNPLLKEEKHCAQCGASFYAYKYRKFCSRKCSGAYASAKKMPPRSREEINLLAREWRKKNHGRYIKLQMKYQKNRYNKKKKIATEIKSGGCYLCDEKEKCALDFHHVLPDTKENGTTSLLMLPRAKFDEELKKCIVLCSNCHRKVHYGSVYLPATLPYLMGLNA